MGTHPAERLFFRCLVAEAGKDYGADEIAANLWVSESILKFVTEYGKLLVKQSEENYAASKLCRGYRAALVISF